eukprot:1841738-Pyramimonas_sp.AAC.1
MDAKFDEREEVPEPPTTRIEEARSSALKCTKEPKEMIGMLRAKGTGPTTMSHVKKLAAMGPKLKDL